MLMGDQITNKKKKVEGRVAEAMKDFPDGVFVKLNTRSPKDVPVNDDDNPEIGKMVCFFFFFWFIYFSFTPSLWSGFPF